MAGDVLLDTNIVIAFFGNDAGVVMQLQQVNLSGHAHGIYRSRRLCVGVGVGANAVVVTA